ncbi:Na+:solute symporter [Luminiphilus sp.]|nr:Na+:solute symporter [Luminiphilus sp.]
MMALAALDWIIILAVLAVTIGIGLSARDRAGDKGAQEFFVAGRSLRWWFVGTSMVATTFASDTPLAITGWVANYGIAGNWFWWSGVLGSVAMTVFFARKWRSSGVITDAELVELRYGGRAATVLRTVKAMSSAVILNSITLGWVLAGMAKISEPFISWQLILGVPAFELVSSYFPDTLIFYSLDNTLTILTLIFITLTYSSIGGIRAVIFTDLFQFIIAMAMSVILSVMVVNQLGGLEAMWHQLAVLYPEPSIGSDASKSQFLSHAQVKSFVPILGESTVGALGMPFSAFVLTLGVLWWTNGAVDGSGFTTQRLYSARDDKEAELGALWYTIAHFVIRSWPWIIVAVAALVIYPRELVSETAEQFNNCSTDTSHCTVEMTACLNDRQACAISEYALLYRTTERISYQDENGKQRQREVQVFVEDRERAYPALLRDVLPIGLKGLALASLMAAFMSTVSTLINWGASYFVNDVYLRFIEPSASPGRQLSMSRLATVIVTVLGLYVATWVDSIGSMWELFLGMMAGLGLPHLLRWFWWRANAWTEIVGMLVGFSLALGNYIYGQTVGFGESSISIFPTQMASHPIHVISWISLVSCVAALTATFLTAPVNKAQLYKFFERVQPIGFWGAVGEVKNDGNRLKQMGISWVLGVIAVYSGLFGIGHLLREERVIGLILLAFGVACFKSMLTRLSAADQPRNGLSGEPLRVDHSEIGA